LACESGQNGLHLIPEIIVMGVFSFFLDLTIVLLW
jgi:hypothetical protein